MKLLHPNRSFLLGMGLILLLSLSFCTTGQSQDDLSEHTEILWDKWGVPHIFAQNNQELFYSFGWAQMHSHGNLILELYAKSRGRAAEYWGKDYIENDQIIHTLGFPALAKEWMEKQKPEMKTYVKQFAAGLNAYAKAHPKTIEADKKVVLPIQEEDVLQHYLFIVYTRFVGGGEFGKVGRWEERGSNTYAISPKRSASGKAMLVQNPHLPWFGEWLFYEAHLNAPGINTYGATLIGFPTLGIAFNEKLGWSHTNNTIDGVDTYELTLKDKGYEWDGEVKAFEVDKFTMKVKQENGEVLSQEVPRLSSIHGPVIKKSDNKALAIRFPGYDRPHAAWQWWKMGTAQSLEEFQSALKMVQIPFFNVMYADQAGNIFYMFNGMVPKRPSEGWDFWDNIVPGNTSKYLWTDVHTYEELPKVENPATGWLQNANDPPWTSTIPRVLDPKDFPPYMSPIFMGFRPQRAVRMIQEDESITFDELVDIKLSTRLEMADRLLDDLFAAIDTHGGDLAKEAKTVLEKWDRETDADSKGAWLFYNWARQINPWNPRNYSEKWELAKAHQSPDGLANPEAAVKTLEAVAKKLKEVYGSLDIAWGEVYRIQYNGLDLPGNGVDGSVGVFRVAWPGGQDDKGRMTIGGGDSWVSIIEFGEKVKAKVLLSYGNSTQKGSPHYGDQLKLFSKKEMRDAWFYREDIEKNLEKREVIRLNTDSELSRQIIGTWKVEAVEGEELGEAEKSVSLAFSKGNKYVRSFGKIKQSGTYSIDEAKQTITFTQDTTPPKIMRNVQVSGNTLSFQDDGVKITLKKQ
ncbi:MAG: penicillin acylase family protein [Bacteroidota bacterium]